MLARDLMTRDVVTVSRETTVKEVSGLLLEHKISGLPVVDKENRVIGIVSEGDLICQDKKLYTPAFQEILGGIIYLENPNRLGQDLMKMTATKVGYLMTAKVYTVREDASLEDIATIMVERKVNRIPVVDGAGRLAGCTATPASLADKVSRRKSRMQGYFAEVEAFVSGPGGEQRYIVRQWFRTPAQWRSEVEFDAERQIFLFDGEQV